MRSAGIDDTSVPPPAAIASATSVSLRPATVRTRRVRVSVGAAGEDGESVGEGVSEAGGEVVSVGEDVSVGAGAIESLGLGESLGAGASVGEGARVASEVGASGSGVGSSVGELVGVSWADASGA
jgi:hypothetical protein